MRCRYCAWDSGVPLTDEIGFDTLKSFISDGIEKGIRSVIIIGEENQRYINISVSLLSL